MTETWDTSIWGSVCLGTLRAVLKELPQDTVVTHGFANPMSYRGFYEELGVVPTAGVSIGSMVAVLDEAEGSTYYGYKGGEYLMTEDTGVWLAEYGCTGEPITSAWLELVRRETTESLDRKE